MLEHWKVCEGMCKYMFAQVAIILNESYFYAALLLLQAPHLDLAVTFTNVQCLHAQAAATELSSLDCNCPTLSATKSLLRTKEDRIDCLSSVLIEYLL